MKIKSIVQEQREFPAFFVGPIRSLIKMKQISRECCLVQSVWRLQTDRQTHLFYFRQWEGKKYERKTLSSSIRLSIRRVHNSYSGRWIIVHLIGSVCIYVEGGLGGCLLFVVDTLMMMLCVLFSFAERKRGSDCGSHRWATTWLGRWWWPWMDYHAAAHQKISIKKSLASSFVET